MYGAQDLLNAFSLSAKQLAQFEKYAQLLQTWNRRMNLTGITEDGEIFLKHFYDSLTLTHVLDVKGKQLFLDVGTGAGFPGLPLKIFYPECQITFLDSLKKRLVFLEEVVGQLGLKGVSFLHGRAEDFAHLADFRERFDLVTARAVAKLNVLLEYCLPYCRVGGTFISMKGVRDDLEEAEAVHPAKILGASAFDVHRLELPEGVGVRHLYIFKKITPTPSLYPRQAGTPKRNPLS